MKKIIDGVEYAIPEHVAIIMDGNGRWAKKHHMPRNMGHVRGAKVVEKILSDAYDLGIRYLTVYAFSTENWNRSEDEVGLLMKLFDKSLKENVEKARKNNVRVRIIGNRTRISKELLKTIEYIEKDSENNSGIDFTIALDYGSRDEIVRAVKKIAANVSQGELDSEDITEDILSKNLDTCDMPDPDLMIRTSGETRLSNWLLWQLAYAEFYFTPIAWPDFDKNELINAIKYYNTRDRRFGGVKEE